MKMIYLILINAHGLPKSSPRDIAVTPFMYGQLNIVHLYDLQGQENIKFLTLHIKRMDTTGKLMVIHMKYIQLIIGMSNPFPTLDFHKFGHLLLHSWLKEHMGIYEHMWNFI